MKKDPVSDWHKACQLLESRQYEQVAEFLQEAQIYGEQPNDAIMHDILVAAHHICLACSRCRKEKRWLKQARDEADRGEQELRQELHDIFDLLGRGRMSGASIQQVALPATSTVIPFESVREDHGPDKRFGFLEHLSRLLKWQLNSFLSPERVVGPRENDAPSLPKTINGVMQTVSHVTPPEVQKSDRPALAIYCLRPFRVYVNETLVEKWSGRKCKSVFKYLLVHREAPIHQEILMDLFWPQANPETARRNLYQAIYKLRQTLQTNGADFPYIVCEDNCYYFNHNLDLWVDSEVFTSYYQTGQRLQNEGHLPAAISEYERAESLYEVEFLAEDIYEDWPVVHRQNLKHAHLDILDQLSRYYFEQGQWAMCIAYCQKILGEDNCREDAHRRLMHCFFRQGQPHLALRQYHLCVEIMKRELAVPPMPATVELYQKIRISRNQF